MLTYIPMQTLPTWKEVELNQLSEAEAFLQELKTNPEGIENSIIKNEYFSFLDKAFEKAKSDSSWAKDVVPALLKLNILDKSEIKEKYMALLDRAFEKAKSDSSWAEYIVPVLLKLNIVDKSEIKEKYMALLDKAFEKAKSDSSWEKYYEVLALLNLNIVDKSEIKEKYMALLDIAFEKAKSNIYWAEYIVPALLKLNILDKSEIKEKYMILLDKAFEKAKSDKYWAYDDKYWAHDVVPALLKLNILDKSEIKEKYMALLDIAFEKAKSDEDWAKDVVPALLNLNIVDKSEIKEKYMALLDRAFKKAESNMYWAEYIVPVLLKLNILDKSDKEKYMILLDRAFEKAESNIYWAEYIVPALLELNILDKSDKEKYITLLDKAFEKAESKDSWAEYIVPALLGLGLNMADKQEIGESPQTYPINSLKQYVFLKKYTTNITPEDIIFIRQIDSILNKEEQNFLFEKDYQFFLDFKNWIHSSDYQKLREIKSACYPEEEQPKLKNLTNYFWNEVWIYFFDKVNRDKNPKNRFRDPHNALLHTDKIVRLAQELEEKWISKADFITNYLGVAGDRNSWYQQLNSFLEWYFFGNFRRENDWREQVESAMEMIEFKNNPEFMEYATRILEQDKTWELYKNLDNLEQIIPVLNMMKNKESLIKLQKLAISKDPKDQVRYHYFKDAIYHPRTRPIIMDLYENPKRFLWMNDSISSGHLHQAKKPSNMVENFEYLDFEAEDLVDCLPLWIYDQVGYFKPFEKQYLIDSSRCYPLDKVKNEIQAFIDSADQKKISVIINSFNKMYPDNILSFKQWRNDKQNFIDDLLSKYDVDVFIWLFTSLGYQEFNKYKNTKLMTAKISPKSDPNNRFNGFNCDSLAEWHGKKVVAMFNPYCTDFCIYEGEQDQNSDNLKVTSWVTLNRKIPQNFSSLLEKAVSNTTHDIAQLLGKDFDDYKDPNEYIMTMDNIEANPNFWNSYASAVRQMYEDFFSEYIKAHPTSPNGIPINTKHFQSGMSYNKIDFLHKTIENNTIPVFVNAYTDNASSQSLKWDLHIEKQVEKQKKTGIHPLSIEDVIPISYLEWKIYPEDLKSHIWNMQHEITASILNNTLKWRENLSFTRYDEEGKLRGYFLAYQWKMEDGRQWIYISDFAIDEKARGRSGVEMINNWIKQVKDHYPEMPVFARARESTSYRMVQVLAKKSGYKITLDKKVQDAGEAFHRVVMEPVDS